MWKVRSYTTLFAILLGVIGMWGRYYENGIIECPTCPSTRILGLDTPGDYIYELRVQDDSGAWSPGDLVAVHVDPGVPLPVKYLFFRGTMEAADNLIEWGTAQEFDTDYFQVEASTDGIHFYYVAYQNAVGNSTQVTRYVFRHVTTAPITYYRLKQVDIDGRFSYSDIIFVSRNVEASVKIQNPSHGFIRIIVTSPVQSPCTVYIFDAIGRQIGKKVTSVFPAQNYIDMPFMRVHGIYFIQCEFANQKIMVKSFID